MSRATVVVTAVLSVGLAAVTGAILWLELSPDVRPGTAAPPLPGSEIVWPPIALGHQVVVPADTDGRPGESFRSTGPSIMESTVDAGVRSDATVRLTGEGDAFLVVVLGRADDLGDPMDLSKQIIETWEVGPLLGGPARVDNGLGETVRIDLSVGTKTLTEWRVEREGWIFVVGVLRRADHPEIEGVAEQMIDSWEWTPATT